MNAPIPPAAGFARRVLEVLMNGKVKIAIAIAILVALGSVVGYDLMRGRRPDSTAEAPGGSPGLTALPDNAPPPEPDGPRSLREFERATGMSNGGAPTTSPAPSPAPVSPPPLPVFPSPEPAGGEEYTVQAGDTLSRIAERKYGDPNLYPLIARANPKVKPSMLRVGTKLTIPTRAPAGENISIDPVVENGVRSYVVQPGDDLGKIAKRFYGSGAADVREQIRLANPEAFEFSTDSLDAGVRLVLPEIAPRTAPRVSEGAPGSRTASSVDPAAPAGRTHAVQRGDSLWTIARKYRGTTGLNDYLLRLVAANADKLESTSTILKSGWVLALPEPD